MPQSDHAGLTIQGANYAEQRKNAEPAVRDAQSTAARRRRRRHTPHGDAPAQNPAPRAPQPKDASRPCPPRQAAPNNRSNAAKPAALKPAQRPARPNNANQARPVAPQLNGQPRAGSKSPSPPPAAAPPPAAGTCRAAPAAQCCPPCPRSPCTGTAAPAAARPAASPRSRVNREPREEDPGLEMISRRPPKQKFANFEEYMAAHGGATAPIAGDGPLPELVPEFHLLSVPAENLVPAEDDE